MAEPDVTCSSDIQHTSDPMDFWKNTLNSAKYVVAPMVDQSELAWRLLSRRHGAQLCYSPMYHAPVFIRDSNYRTEALATCDEDRPLIIQFCANNPEVLLKAAKYAQDHCDAIDLNIGCPQAIAKRGHYGAFLQDEWDLLQTMVSQCAKELRVPITCKIRIFDDVEKTVKYALMLESAGCKLLTVHGRTREQKGPFTGIASWTHIRAVRDAIKIPMFANGNIQYLDDVHRCIAETNVQGVMSAEGNLHNPALFEGTQVPCWELSEEYLELVEKYPCPNSYVRGHLFKMCHHALLMHTEVRDQLASVKKLSEFKPVITNLKKACETDVEDHKSSNPDSYTQKLPHPYWLCQPYVRPCPKDSDDLPNNHEKRSRGTPSPDGYEDRVSKNKLKKLRRNPNKNFVPKGEQYEKCKCGNPRGMKCEYKLCKNCCWQHAKEQINDCAGHKILLKTLHKRRKEIAKNKGHDEPDNHCNKDAENCVSREHVDKESDINLPDPTDCCGNR